MDHEDARELMELSAVEPGGLDRIMAGDTPDAARLAGHLAGCPSCTAEAAAMRRDATLIADAVRLTPPADLRERTLAAVAALGRSRTALAPASPVASEAPAGAEALAPSQRARPRPSFGWLAVAAALVVAIGATGLIVSAQKDAQTAVLVAQRDARIAQTAESVADLVRVANWTLRVGAEPGARWVQLASATGATPRATVLFDRSTQDLVVVGSGLLPPQGGMQYRCWVDVGGDRQPVGRMFFAGDLAYWVGKAPALGTVASGAQFGISLVAADGAPIGDPVLTGSF